MNQQGLMLLGRVVAIATACAGVFGCVSTSERVTVRNDTDRLLRVAVVLGSRVGAGLMYPAVAGEGAYAKMVAPGEVWEVGKGKDDRLLPTKSMPSSETTVMVRSFDKADWVAFEVVRRASRAPALPGPPAVLCAVTENTDGIKLSATDKAGNVLNVRLIPEREEDAGVLCGWMAEIK